VNIDVKDWLVVILLVDVFCVVWVWYWVCVVFFDDGCSCVV